MHRTPKMRLPDSRHGFVNRGRKNAGREHRSVSPPHGEATPHHHMVPQVILPTMYTQSSTVCNRNTGTLSCNDTEGGPFSG